MGKPLAALAFESRAPSRKMVASPSSRASAQMRSTSACGTTTPPARLCVFSTSTSVVVGKIGKLRGFHRGAQIVYAELAALPDLVGLDTAIGPSTAKLVPGGVRLAAGTAILRGIELPRGCRWSLRPLCRGERD
jgi:hypothetical protein